MNLPAVAPTDIALRHDLLAACVFFQSRSVRSKMAITLARKASVFLDGWRIRAVDEGPSRRSQVLSEAIDYGLHWCPRFNIDRFKDGA